MAKNTPDVSQRMRELRETVASASRQIASLRNDRRLSAEMRLQLEEAADGIEIAERLLLPLPGHRVYIRAA